MSPAGSRTACTKGAVTFIELILVVAILATLGGATLIHFRNNFNTLQLDNSARELQSFMNYLHERSIVESKVIQLNIDNGNKEYWAQAKDNQTRLRSYPIPKEVTIEVSRKLGSSDAPVTFYPDGQIDKVTIQLENSDKRNVNLTTEGMFGKVKLQEPQ